MQSSVSSRPLIAERDLQPGAYVLACAVVLGLTFVQGAYRLSCPSLWFDEAASWHNVTSGIRGVLAAALRTEDCGGVLYALLLYVWTQLGGFSEAALRLPSVAFAVGFVGSMLALGRLRWNRTASICVGLLAALHPMVLVWSRTARAYTLEMLATGLCLLLLTARERRAGDRRLGGLLALSGCLLVLSHIYGVLPMVGMFCYLAASSLAGGPPAHRLRHFWQTTWPTMIPLLVAAAWISQLREPIRQTLNDFWITSPIWVAYAATLMHLLPVALVTLPVSAAGLGALWSKRQLHRDGRGVALILVVGGFVLAGPAIASAFCHGSHHLVLPRYFVPMVPLVVLPMGYLCSRCGVRLGLLAALLLGLLWLLTANLPQYYGSAGQDGDVRAAASLLRSRCAAEDQVLVSPEHHILTLQYYQAEESCRLVGVSPSAMLTRVDPRRSRVATQREWLVVFNPLTGLVAPQATSLQGYKTHAWGALLVLEPARDP